MKSVFITFDQAHYEHIVEALDKSGCRGFTSFGTVQGRGSKTGEPHYGSHAWPSLAGAIICMAEDDKVPGLLARLKDLDDEKPRLGLRAFVWNIEQAI